MANSIFLFPFGATFGGAITTAGITNTGDINNTGNIINTGNITEIVNNLVVTSTDGLTLANNTAATAGVPVQISPRLRFRANVWNTAANETSDFFFENLPATAATPTALLKIGYSRNGGAATYPLIIGNVGDVTISNQVFSTAFGAANALSRIIFGSVIANDTVISGARIGFNNTNNTIGAIVKVDALPTVASGFGGTPSITAGSTPLAGSVNVGTGGVATSGVINFNGTAFPSAPFVICMNTTTGAIVRATTSTTQLTITAAIAFVASDIISWVCISSK